MTDIDARLREDVHNLGTLLGQTIQAHLGDDFLQRIERIRLGAKKGRKADQAANEALLGALQDLPDSQLLPVCRAFNQFLNLLQAATFYHIFKSSIDQFINNLAIRNMRQLKGTACQSALAGH